jgi:phytoene desaturase
MYIDPQTPVPIAAVGDKRPHAVVIGSGFGGLAAAVRLGARGYRVTVLEKQDRAGGRAAVYRQDGFTFDAGPTIITAPFLFEELWQLAGRRMADDVTLRMPDPFYRILFNDGSVFDCVQDEAKMRAQVERFAPADLAGYDRFMAMSEQIYKVGFEEMAHIPFQSITDMLWAAPKLLKLQGWRSIHSLAAKYMKDERLRMAMSFHPLFIGGHPFRTTAIYALISHLERTHGVHFAVGGTGKLVEGLIDLIHGQRNHVALKAEVKTITVKDGRASGVELVTGQKIPADIVVSNMDSAATYERLVPPEVPRTWRIRRLKRSKFSMSLFVWYFGTSRTYDHLPHHQIVMGPRYRGLIDDIFDRKILAEDFSLYIHRPTASDPSLAPPGCDAFYVLSPVPNLDSGIDWDKMAEPYRQRIAKRLQETIMPDLEQSIVTSRLLTPPEFGGRLASAHGSAFGIEPVLTQSAWFRPPNRSEELDGLYLVGAGTHPGAGVPGVLSSARVLDKVVPDASVFAR